MEGEVVCTLSILVANVQNSGNRLNNSSCHVKINPFQNQPKILFDSIIESIGKKGACENGDNHFFFPK